jgi:Zn-dependent protease
MNDRHDTELAPDGAPSPTRRPPRWRAWLAPLGATALLLLKFGSKLKFLIVPLLKFFPLVLKTGGTMVLSIVAYATVWGVWFAVGFVLLIFVHELGHLLAARKCGLKVGAPVFIPFMGAFIALKDAPRDAWIEAQVGIGGPLLGALGAAVCEGIHLATGEPLFRALAYTGFFLNLFNLTPVGFLDGGRIVTALSPWLWLVGFAVLVAMTVAHPNFLLVMILLLSLPRLWFLLRPKSEAERRYFEVAPGRRLAMGALYFGLIAALVGGMHVSHIPREHLARAEASVNAASAAVETVPSAAP